IVFILFFSILTNVLFTRSIYAQNSQQNGWYDTGYAESIKSAEEGDVNAAGHVSNVNYNNYSDLIRRTLGPVPGFTTTETGMTPYNQRLLSQSAVYNVGSYIGAMYGNPPASTYAFIRDVGQTLGFIPKSAYAQGVGFSGLSALLPIWKAFRNVAYFLLAIIMVVIGFLVMFRKKIDPKTVVTVQNALPRIVITLLLITFSYAIVGLLIDLMYILIALVIGLFISTGMFPDITQPSTLVNSNLLSVVFKSVSPWDIPWRILGHTGSGVTADIIAALLGGGVAAAVLAISANVVAIPAVALISIGALILGLGGAIFGALIGIGMLLLAIRLFIFSLSTYIRIILALLFGPLQLLMGAIPGNDAFGSWFKNLLANILIFPASAAMFMLAAMFMNFSTNNSPMWTPPYVGFISGSSTSIGALVALGILFAIPTVGKQIQEALKSKGGMSAGLEGVAGAFSGPTQMGMQLFQYWSSHKQMADLGKKLGGDKTKP
ncbi:MAG: hypothetical protein ABH833_03465, partial [Parcubacteria group bacterium]